MNNRRIFTVEVDLNNPKVKKYHTMYVLEDTGGSSGGSDSEIFDGYIDATDQQRNTALANVSNQTANSTTGKMGYKVLNPTKTFAEQVTAENTIYEIKDVFDLGGNEFTIPSNVKFNFNGGVIKNGVLNGEFNTTLPLKGSNIGLIYGNTTYTDGNSNVNKLKLLSKITNKVTLHLEDDLYVHKSSEPNFVYNNISIDGHGHKIGNYGTALPFRVKKDVELRNTIVETTESHLRLFKIEDDQSVSNVIINNCVFSGNLRIIDSYKYADENKSKYFDTIKIENNKFINISCNRGGRTTLSFGDSNFKKAIIKNNEIKNHYGEFISFGITNGSSYVGYIQDFADTIGRNLIVEYNSFINDLDYKPWTIYDDAPSYNCFVLAEKGDCLYSNNHIENIIGNNSVTATYDAYLSVNNLVYDNNFWKNNINLEGSYNEFLKSKTGSGSRIYKNNKFITTDISSYFEEIDSTPYIQTVNFQDSAKSIFVLENNDFSIFNFTGSKSLYNKVGSVYILNNRINIENVSHSNAGFFISLRGSNQYTEIKGNYMNIANFVATSSYDSSALVYSTNSNNIICSDNTLVNCIPIEQAGDSLNCTVKNNTITLNSNYGGSSIVKENKSGFRYYDNIFNNSKRNVNTITYLKNPCYLKFIANINNSIYLTDELDKDSITKAVIKVTNLITGGYGLFEYNVKYVSNTKTCKYLDRSTKIYSEGTSPQHSNLGNSAVGTFNNYSLSQSDSTLQFLFEISIEKITDFNYFKNILNKGTTTQRPADITIPNGFQYFDTTLSKYICWNGTAWVNLDGTALS